MNLSYINTSDSMDALINVQRRPKLIDKISDLSQIQISNKKFSVHNPESIQQKQGQDLKDTKQLKEEENKAQPTAEETDKMLEDLNDYMNELQTSLRFSMSEDLDHQLIVKIKNRDTDEVIKQIPSEELLNIKKKMEELTGILLDHSV